VSATGATTTDRADVLELHHQFVAANENIDVDWLRAHLAPGDDALVWFNLNKSDYIGAEHICRLWEFLRVVAGGADQHVESMKPTVHVVGDVAWVDSHIRMRADFGPMGKVEQTARMTEIWVRAGGGWLMHHFHCSEHEPDGWEGGQ
jgi:ketosteroid isomerase-like protein